MAPDQANFNPQESGLFDPDRWQRRRLTHQLDALIKLRETKGQNEDLEKLIRHLSTRINRQLIFNSAVVDIYIQKVLFVLRTGSPEKLRRRWIEKVIANQLPDGGWNDKWFCFTSRRRPTLDFKTPPSDQHATIQALTLLYLVKHCHLQHFSPK